jgi:hypothetical protein
MAFTTTPTAMSAVPNQRESPKCSVGAVPRSVAVREKVRTAPPQIQSPSLLCQCESTRAASVLRPDSRSGWLSVLLQAACPRSMAPSGHTMRRSRRCRQTSEDASTKWATRLQGATGQRTPYSTRSIVTDSSTTGLCGLSCELRATLEMATTMSCPSTTSPKIV